MIIQENMKADSPICPHDVEWIGTLYSQTIKAATVSNLDEVRECMEWCNSVQSQAITWLSAYQLMKAHTVKWIQKLRQVT